jgi:predicted N-acetyltransferase YhbS
MNDPSSLAVTFHTASLSDVQEMLRWAAQEGWAPGLDDEAALWSSDPEGFFVARSGPQMVAAISVVNHDAATAFLGLYLCKPEYRGKGIGFGLWSHALQHAADRAIGLDGVAAQEANYARSGFIRQGATTRFQGYCPIKSPASITRPIDPANDLAHITTLDMQAIGYERKAFLSAWLAGDVASRKTVVAEQDGQIYGYATARRCTDVAKIGPIVAIDNAFTLPLMCSAAQAIGASKIMVDVPDTQIELRTQLAELGFEATFETAHMYRGTAPKRSQSYRAVATMECG